MRFSYPLGLALCCVTTFATAQQTVPTPKLTVPKLPAPAAQSSTKGGVTLDVVVTDKKGVPVSGLHQHDFTLELDKKRQNFTGFQAVEASTAGTASIETILLVDTVNTRFTHVAYERQEIERFLKQNGGKLAQPTSIAVFTDTGTKIMPQATLDGNQLATFIDSAESNIREIGDDAGFYGAVERFQDSIAALKQITTYEEGRPGRKLLIWVSPGWPLLSGPEVELTDKDQKDLFATLVDVSASLRKARITLSSVDPLGTADAVTSRTFFYEEFTKGVPSAREMQIGNLALQVMAIQTGGRVINSDNDIAREIADAASDAQAFYTLTIKPPPATHPNDYHAITVSVDKHGLTARTRSGYYAQP